MSITSYLAYALALAIAAAIPGPGITAIVGTALGRGFRATVPMVTGLVLGDLFYLALATLGLAVMARELGGVFEIVRYAGAAYLAFLAWRFWRIGITPESVDAAGRVSNRGVFLSGLAVTLGNPKTIVFYVALMPAVVPVGSASLADFGVLALLTIAVLYLVVLPYAWLAARARHLMKSPRALRLVGRTAATAMGSAAAAVMMR